MYYTLPTVDSAVRCTRYSNVSCGILHPYTVQYCRMNAVEEGPAGVTEMDREHDWLVDWPLLHAKTIFCHLLSYCIIYTVLY